MLGFIKKSPEHHVALERVREWTRARFTLTDEATIVVWEVACALPGCPPLETVIVFWEGETRHHFKIFKPVSEVAAADLPFAWLKDAFAVPEDFMCDCC